MSNAFCKKFDIRVDAESEIPIYVQLKNQLRYLIQNNILKPGEQLPTVRELAVELAINPNTVTRVYADLESEGVIKRIQGVGTFVAEKLYATTKKDVMEEAEAIVAGCVKTLRGMNLTDYEIRKILRRVAENITDF